jgi:WD40 repeat protein
MMCQPRPDRRQFAIAALGVIPIRASAGQVKDNAKARVAVKLKAPMPLDCVSDVAFSSDAKVFVLHHDEDNAQPVTVWDSDGNWLCTLGGHNFPDVRLFAVVDGGKTVVAWGGKLGFCVAWDVKTAKLRTVFEKAPGAEEAHGTASADGKRIATVHDGGGCLTLIRVWDAATGKQLWELNYAKGQEIVYGVAFSPDGKRLAAGTQDGDATVYDATSGKLLVSLDCGAGEVKSVRWSADGKRLLALQAGPRPRAAVWDVGTNKLVGSASGNLQNPPLGVELSPDGTRVAGFATDKGLAIWDVPSEKPAAEQKLSGRRGFAWSADGKSVVVVREYPGVHELLVFDVATLLAKN